MHFALVHCLCLQLGIKLFKKLRNSSKSLFWLGHNNTKSMLLDYHHRITVKTMMYDFNSVQLNERARTLLKIENVFDFSKICALNSNFGSSQTSVFLLWGEHFVLFFRSFLEITS